MPSSRDMFTAGPEEEQPRRVHWRTTSRSGPRIGGVQVIRRSRAGSDRMEIENLQPPRLDRQIFVEESPLSSEETKDDSLHSSSEPLLVEPVISSTKEIKLPFDFTKIEVPMTNNEELAKLLSGETVCLKLTKDNFSYFQDLFELIEPLENIKALYLDGLRISGAVQAWFFPNFPNVSCLKIENCSNFQWSLLKKWKIEQLELEKIQFDSFQIPRIICDCGVDVDNLKYLYLSDIKSNYDTPLIHIGYHRDLTHLSVKNSNFCFISANFCRIQEFYIENLPCLTEINELSSGEKSIEIIHIESCPELLGKYLKNLLFKMNSILPLDKTKKLKSLTIKNQEWESWEIPETNFESLEYLHVENTPISDLLLSDKLVSVIAKNVDIEHIPNTFFSKCANLKTLRIKSPLTSIDGIEHCKKLEILELYDTFLRDIPKAISTRASLEEFALSNCNTLRKFPINWTDCTKLKTFLLEKTAFNVENEEKFTMYFRPIANENNLSFVAPGFDLKHMTLLEYKFKEFETVTQKNNFQISSHFKCPICHCLLQKASVNHLGYTYCHECIQHWIGLRPTEPQTNQHLTSKRIFPNRTIRTLVDEYLEKHDSIFSPFLIYDPDCSKSNEKKNESLSIDYGKDITLLQNKS
jgi:hypothetical protein